MRCPFCHDDIGNDQHWVACVACLARHHDSCFSEAGCCATCKGRDALDPRNAQRFLTPDEKKKSLGQTKRSVLRVVGYFVLGSGIDAVLGWWIGYEPRLWFGLPMIVGAILGLVLAVSLVALAIAFAHKGLSKVFGRSKKNAVSEAAAVSEEVVEKSAHPMKSEKSN